MQTLLSVFVSSNNDKCSLFPSAVAQCNTFTFTAKENVGPAERLTTIRAEVGDRTLSDPGD